ncbi:hypothetical protein [Spirosoma panaciterrae]|uniref:hypothetical protein n=1 Tax=Spirosoma panaciterrae TaxID=496058 RepID=UPI0012F96B05|nr:hypothetical protein [Spirosoma panaciterrae]
MKSFLDGYLFATCTHHIKNEEGFPPFLYFHEWARCKYRWRESTSGWANIILTETNHDEEIALQIFFEMIDEFKTLHPIRIEKAKLTTQNLAFHHSDQCRIRYDTGKPIYDHADEVFIVKFSHEFGYAYAVTGQAQVQNLDIIPPRSLKSKKPIQEKLTRLFGPINSWEVVKGDLNKVLEHIL